MRDKNTPRFCCAVTIAFVQFFGLHGIGENSHSWAQAVLSICWSQPEITNRLDHVETGRGRNATYEARNQPVPGATSGDIDCLKLKHRVSHANGLFCSKSYLGVFVFVRGSSQFKAIHADLKGEEKFDLFHFWGGP